MKTAKTYSPRPQDIEQRWHLIDASGQPVGRLATKIAHLLRGKHKASFTPHVKMGDYVIVINASKIQVTGKKAEGKLYRWHTLWPGGLRERSFKQLLQEHPERVIQRAVRGMLPHNALGRGIFRMLKVYPGAGHPHEAQLRGGVMRPAAAWVLARRAQRKAAEAKAPVVEAAAAAPSKTEAPEVEAPRPGRRGAPARRGVRTLAEREKTKAKPRAKEPKASSEEASAAKPESEESTAKPERGEEKS